MDVEAFGKGLFQLRDVGDVRQQPQLDLAVVGADQLVALLRDEGLADAAPFLGTHRDVLQVGIGRGQAPRGGGRHGIGRMHPPRLLVDIAGQRIGVGAAQFCEAAPVQHLPGNRMTLRRHVFQHIGIGGPGAGLGLAAAFHLHLVEQDFAQLLGRADIEFLAGQLVDFGFQQHLLLGKIIGQLAQHFRINGDAGALHVGQHHHQRPLQRLIDGALAGLLQFRLQHHVQAQGDIGIFRRIFRRFRHRHAIESQLVLVLALAGHFRECNRRVRQVQLRQLVHPVPMQPAFQHIGHQHGVIYRVQPDAALQEDGGVVFQVLADLQDAVVFQQRLEPWQHIGFGHLHNGVLAILRLGQVQGQPVAAAMAAGHITGLARRNGQRHAAQAGGHGVQRSGFGIHADQAFFARARDPGVQVLGGCDGDIGVAVDRRTQGSVFLARFGLKLRQFGFWRQHIGHARRRINRVHIVHVEVGSGAAGDAAELHRL